MSFSVSNPAQRSAVLVFRGALTGQPKTTMNPGTALQAPTGDSVHFGRSTGGRVAAALGTAAIAALVLAGCGPADPGSHTVTRETTDRGNSVIIPGDTSGAQANQRTVSECKTATDQAADHVRATGADPKRFDYTCMYDGRGYANGYPIQITPKA